MFKNKGYFIETVVYQVIWIITSSVISMIIFEGLDTIVYKNISDNQFNGLYSAYFSFGRYGIIVMLLLIIICGTFYIQKKRFDKYNQYFESGLKYLTQESNKLLEFHESLSAERDAFIELRNYNKELQQGIRRKV